MSKTKNKNTTAIIVVAVIAVILLIVFSKKKTTTPTTEAEESNFVRGLFHARANVPYFFGERRCARRDGWSWIPDPDEGGGECVPNAF